MNVLDSLKDFFMPADDNEPEAPNMTAPEEEPAAASTATASSSYSNAGYTRTSSYDDRKNNERYATIKATAYTSDSKKVADYLMQNKTVVLNLEGIEEPDKRRIIDFVVGAAYAMHGRIKPIANQTFLIIPQNVGFDGDSFVGELQGSGLV